MFHVTEGLKTLPPCVYPLFFYPVFFVSVVPHGSPCPAQIHPPPPAGAGGQISRGP